MMHNNRCDFENILLEISIIKCILPIDTLINQKLNW